MAMAETRNTCQLYVGITAGPTAHDHLAAALAAAAVASVLIAPPPASPLDITAIKPLVDRAQQAGAAALILVDAVLARTLGADGVHLGPVRDVRGTYQAARGALGQRAIIGVDAGTSRHDAMVLAEDGADYIAFGAPSHPPALAQDRHLACQRRNDLVVWWAELFEPPCVAFDVETAREAEKLARAGADFVAIDLPAGRPPAATRDLVAEMAAAIRMCEGAQ
jgi:thiamine-phosphate pyrophosphorylase